MNSKHTTFSTSYADARALFLRAANELDVQVQSYIHPLKGKDGETLAMDIVRLGAAKPTKLLIVSSGCHGVEGYCGSGVQIAALQDAGLQQQLKAAAVQGVGVLMIHALNPYGFSNIRRFTHENVDLNRNFCDFNDAATQKTNAADHGYGAVHSLLLGVSTWPPAPADEAKLGAWIAQNGIKALQTVVSRGQYTHEDGLFFGGFALTWSNQTLRQVLREHTQGVARLGWIDLHTGLGPSGHGERIFAGDYNPAALARTTAWWGGAGKTPITNTHDGSSSSADLVGQMYLAVQDECPQAEYTGIAMEYGTLSPMQVMQALRGEAWLHDHPETAAAVAAPIKQALMDAFYTQTDEWKAAVLAQGLESIAQGIKGLAEAG